MHRLQFSFISIAIGIASIVPVAAQNSNSSKSANTVVKPASVHFIDIARQVGLDANNVFGGDAHKEFIIETTGNGAIIFDYDNDGWPDIFLPNGSTIEGFQHDPPVGHLYHNNHDGTFTDVTRTAGLARPGWGQGGCVGDYDNDGYLDLLVTYWGQNTLYHNNGNGTFTDVTKKAGLLTTHDEWSTGCSFVDYDRDGKVDLFIARYVDFSYDTVPRPGQGQFCQWKGINVMCGPRGLKAPSNALYHNDGNGTFDDVSQKSGITNASGCYGFTAISSDFDKDGWPDLYLACDSTANLLYHNNRNGTFSEIGKNSALAYNEDGALQAGMGLSVSDFNHSGYQSVIKTNFSDDTPTLYLNHGNNVFEDVTYTSGLGKIKNWLGWGVQFLDFDNSGWPGILIANGHVYPEVDGKGLGTSYREPKLAYYNLHNGTFANITGESGAVLSEHHSGRGMALGDLFNNGREEALVNNMNEVPSLYYNTAPVGNFVSLQLVGTKSNRAALGASLTLINGNDHQDKEVRSGEGFISQNDLRVHFGLGTLSAAEKIVIRWPSGTVDTLTNVPANKYYIVNEGAGIDTKKIQGPSRVSFSQLNDKD